MFSGLLEDIRLYKHLIGMQIRAQAQYKVDLALGILTMLLFTCLEFMAVLLFFTQFPRLGDWSVGDVALLAAIMALGAGIAEVIGAGVDTFDKIIRLGEFDRLLLRPVGAFMQVLGSDFRLRRLGRFIEGVIVFVVALRFLPGLHWTLAKVIILPIGIVSGAFVFIAILLLGATLCFWTVETTELTNLLYDGGREMLNYPIIIYNDALKRVFLFVVPLAFGSYVPTCYILGKPLPFGLPAELAFVAPLVALAFALVSGFVWNFGVKHYQSTGS